MNFMKSKFSLIIVGIGWMALVSIGLMKLYNYEFKSGPEGSPIGHWPDGSHIHRDNKVYQLVMVVHPHCPCSRATLHELELIMARAQDQLSVYMLFTHPKQFSREWVKTDLFNDAQKISNVHVIIDQDSQEAKLFGGTTSGQAFLFDTNGNILFSGGITDSRGHEGDNVGMTAIIDILQNKRIALKQTPVFGCLLYNEDSQVDNDSLHGRDENVER